MTLVDLIPQGRMAHGPVKMIKRALVAGKESTKIPDKGLFTLVHFICLIPSMS